MVKKQKNSNLKVVNEKEYLSEAIWGKFKWSTFQQKWTFLKKFQKNDFQLQKLLLVFDFALQNEIKTENIQVILRARAEKL